MAWVRIDDGFPDHPKIAQVGPLALAMQVSALCYANRHLTDGFIPFRVAAQFMATIAFDPETGEPISWRDVAQTLVDARIWKAADGGYIIHDYHDYQPTREHVLKEREEARKRMAEARARKRKANNPGSSDEVPANNGRTSDNPTPVPGPDPVPTSQTQGKTDSVAPGGSTTPKAPKFGEGDTPYELARHLRAAILHRDETTKVPPDTPDGLAKWSEEADRMLRIDKRDPKEAANLMTWAQRDSFWCANILSMPKFRKQYDTLKRQARARSPNGRSASVFGGDTLLHQQLREEGVL